MQNCSYKIIIFLLWGVIAGIAYGGALDPTRVGMGARAIALGRSQAAARDLFSTFVNPANASALEHYGFTSMYGTLAEDSPYTLIGAGFPIREGTLGTVGVSFLSLGVSGIQVTTFDATGRAQPLSSFDYNNRLLTVSYGKEINPRAALGASLKYFSRAFEGQASASGFDLDAGILYYPQKNLTLGLALQNLLPVDWANLAWAKTREDIPLNLKMGLVFTPREDWLLIGDYDSAGGIHAGAEWVVRKFLALRGGMENLPSGKSSTVTNYSLGVGLRYAGFNFDYAYYLDSLISANSSHFFSLSLELPFKTMETPAILPARAPSQEVAPLTQVQKKTVVITKKKAKTPPPKKKVAAKKNIKKKTALPELTRYSRR